VKCVGKKKIREPGNNSAGSRIVFGEVPVGNGVGSVPEAGRHFAFS